MLLGELNFNQFVNQHNLRNLPINEQIRQYNYYLQDYTAQNKGTKQLILQSTGFLLQEDLFVILQEGGSGIYITSYA